jgi:hypothetical protein
VPTKAQLLEELDLLKKFRHENMVSLNTKLSTSIRDINAKV